jgi:NAD(P)-dependent dehydrogenase (short-subunit alcohol dehydrogenase family)
MNRFAGRHAIVTGAGSGIGREVTLGLSQEGAASVTLVDVDEAALGSLSRDLTEAGCEVVNIVGDAGDEETWDRTKRAVSDNGLDVIVNNAGIAQIKPVDETTLADWHRVVDVNLTSVFLCAKYLFPLMRDGGAVVNVASVAALLGQSSTPAYIASKGGVVAFTRGLAVDYAHRRLRVNAVCPGPTDTPLLRRHFELLGDPGGARQHLENRIPLGRLLKPTDVHPLILLLVSEEAAMISGATFVVDGGLSATFDYGSGLVQSGTTAQ